MVLVLFFLSLIILLSFLIVLTSIISIQLDIKNFKFEKEEKVEKKTNKDYEVFVFVYLLKKIKIFKYKINDKKISKKYFQKIQNRIDLSILKLFFSNNYDISNVKFVELESLNLNLKIGTENVILTSGIVTLSNILFSIVLPRLIDKNDEEKYRYTVKPIYENKNKIDLFLESKIRIKLFSLLKAFRSYSKAKKKVTQNRKKLYNQEKVLV